MDELQLVEKKMVFIYQYLMFFRSKHGREISVKLKRGIIGHKEYQMGLD